MEPLARKQMDHRPLVFLITGTRKGIGAHLVKHYLALGHQVVGCSRGQAIFESESYRHFCLDVAAEADVRQMFAEISTQHGRLDVLINNAGVASMNHTLLMPTKTAREIMETNFLGTFLLCREGARLMRKHSFGRIINLATVATPLKLEGEAVYAASKAAVISFTQIIAREFAEFGITANVVAPTPIHTDLIKSVPQEKLHEILKRQAIKRPGEFRDVTNVIDFFIRPESDFITGQVLFLGGV
jgi:3-oxoacyl-[acyl-carrier protein] reductase